MTTSRLRTGAAGAAIAVTAALVADQGAVLGADLPTAALLGTALGAVLALVPDRGLAARAGGFVAGILAGWLGYALRAGFLPDIPAGRAVAAMVVIGAVTAVAVASDGRVPLWAGLLGVGTMVGAYETAFTTAPTAFVSESTTAVTTALVAAALGILVAGAATLLPNPSGSREQLDELEEVDESPPAARIRRVPAPRASVDASLDADVEQDVSR